MVLGGRDSVPTGMAPKLPAHDRDDNHLLKPRLSQHTGAFVGGRSGGEDTNLFYRIRRSGGRLVWADDAIVRECVPVERATIPYLMRCSFRGGQVYASITLPDFSLQKIIAWFGFRSLISLLGLVLLPLFWLGGRVIGMKALQKVASNLGQLSVLLPFRVKEYCKQSI